MDRLARLRTRSSAGGPLNASTTSSLAAGYETANDESLVSGSGSMYFSMSEDGTKTTAGEEEAVAEEEPTLSGTLAISGHSSSGVVDQTLENDFSVEEVSTIRKATIAHASPATVQVAAGMAVKYLGVSSTPAAVPKTPKSVAKPKDLSGIEQLDQTPSIMKKMRDPKTPAESPYCEDPEESKVTLDGSGLLGPVPSNKSYGTNVLANFFASLDVNSATPGQPEIKVTEPEEALQPVPPTTSGTTPNTKRDSNSCENFFESLKKNPTTDASSRRKSLVRKSLIPKVAAIARQNRVASPISRRSTAVRLIPDKLREMRKTNQTAEQLVQFRRKSVAVPMATATATVKKSEESVPVRKSMAVAAVKAASTVAVANRKSVVPPATANGRKSVLPAVSAVRRGVVSTTAAPRVALKIPAKTTLSNGPDGSSSSSSGITSASTRRTLLGKRPATAAAPVTATSSLPDKLTPTEQPAAKQRKSLAPVVKEAIRVSPRNKPVTAPQQSRIRPPTSAASFKKPETFTCGHCQRIFRLRSSYETHLKTVHQNSTTPPQPSPTKSSEVVSSGAKCQYCGKAFAGARFLTNHVVSNCDKVPLPEKRRLLAEGERERAASVKRGGTPDGKKKQQRMSIRPPTTTGSGASNRSASSSTTTRSGDETDTSTCSSNGGGGSGGMTRKKVTVPSRGGGGGISRTPNKELKCHLCARRFLNAVEYALHVQAHAKNGKPTGGGGDGEDVENQQQEQIGSEEVSKLVQKLVTLTKGNGKVAGAVLKSSNVVKK
ncbi:hypothetical protein quinque_002233 [Culex quinquefasciatus]